MKNEKVFRCQCYSEVLVVSSYEDEDSIEFAIYEQHPFRILWKDRIRFAWRYLRGRHPYTDQMIFDKETLADLVDYLVELQNKDL